MEKTTTLVLDALVFFGTDLPVVGIQTVMVVTDYRDIFDDLAISDAVLSPRHASV